MPNIDWSNLDDQFSVYTENFLGLRSSGLDVLIASKIVAIAILDEMYDPEMGLQWSKCLSNAGPLESKEQLLEGIHALCSGVVIMPHK